jgi:DNA recombination protein Rad52
MTDFSPEQVAALKAPLARENVKEREQSGRKLSYIEGWVAINEANRIFGFDGWDRETIECRMVCERERKIGQQQRDGWSVSYVAKVRVTVRPGRKPDGLDLAVHREGTGYGSGIDVDLGAAHESAIKEAETDAMKRALMTFGNPFGLALYDKAQAEVEPVARSQAPQRPAQATNGKAKVEHPRREEARAAWQRIHSEITNAASLTAIEATIKANSDNLGLIKEVHPESYMSLMSLANARKAEFFGATG